MAETNDNGIVTSVSLIPGAGGSDYSNNPSGPADTTQLGSSGQAYQQIELIGINSPSNPVNSLQITPYAAPTTGTDPFVANLGFGTGSIAVAQPGGLFVQSASLSGTALLSASTTITALLGPVQISGTATVKGNLGLGFMLSIANAVIPLADLSSQLQKNSPQVSGVANLTMGNIALGGGLTIPGLNLSSASIQVTAGLITNAAPDPNLPNSSTTVQITSPGSAGPTGPLSNGQQVMISGISEISTGPNPGPVANPDDDGTFTVVTTGTGPNAFDIYTRAAATRSSNGGSGATVNITSVDSTGAITGVSFATGGSGYPKGTTFNLDVTGGGAPAASCPSRRMARARSFPFQEPLSPQAPAMRSPRRRPCPRRTITSTVGRGSRSSSKDWTWATCSV